MEMNETDQYILVIRGESPTKGDVKFFQLMEMFTVKTNQEKANEAILDISRKEGFSDQQIQNIQKLLEQKRNLVIFEEFETQGKKGKFTGIAPLTKESFIGILGEIYKNFDKYQLISLLDLILYFPPIIAFQSEELITLIVDIQEKISSFEEIDKIKPTIH